MARSRQPPPALALVVCALLLVVAGARGRPARAAEPLTVLAAASLTEALQQVGAAWTAQGHAPVSFSFDASSRLARQIEAGVPADVFVSADEAWMDTLAGKGLVAADTRARIARNTLVAVVGRAASVVPSDARGLADPAIRHLALAGENVPAGRYARAALGSLGVWASVAPRVVVGDDVRATLAWVARGEAQAGVVYATDARVEARVRVAFTFPASSHPPIVYPAAALAASPQPAEAARFVAFCRSSEAQRVFAAAGFGAP